MTHAYLTPDTPTGSYACRRLSIPVELLHIVSGALETLTHDWSYEAFGTMTPAEAAEAMTVMYSTYRQSEGECVDMLATVVYRASNVATDGMLLCDGTVYDRVDYPSLYAVLDAAFIIDADTFSIDLDNIFIMGSVTAAGTTGGESTHVLTVNEMPAHDHTDNTVTTAPSAVLGTITGVANEAPAVVVTGSTGGGQAHENKPPYMTLYPYIIAR